MQHLTKATQEFLSQKPDKNQLLMYLDEDVWINYDISVNLLNEILALADAKRKHRMMSMAIAAPPNNGKTSLIKEVCKAKKKIINPSGIVCPVISAELTSNVDLRTFLNLINKAINGAVHYPQKLDSLRDHVLDCLLRYQVKLIIIDEVQLLANLTTKRLRMILDEMKTISNIAQVSFVVFGSDELDVIFSYHPHIRSRFVLRNLPEWQYNEAYLRLLATIESELPFSESSNLTKKETALLILEKTNGTIGEILSVLKELATIAIHEGKNCIDVLDIPKLNFQTAKPHLN
ncbi:MAG: TniB family NTP-binding protein [Cyclobacteriaceae bacterium]|nr:TniB family NTP-binding protein [Cyclobacteriaceae bacterium]